MTIKAIVGVFGFLLTYSYLCLRRR